MKNCISLYSLLDSESIEVLLNNGFNVPLISIPHFALGKQIELLDGPSSSRYIFDFSSVIYDLENAHSMIDRNKLLSYFSSRQYHPAMVSLDTIYKLLSDPALLLMAERQRFGYKRNADLADRCYSLVQFWLTLISNNNIEAIIFGEIPHHFDDYVLLVLSRIFAIPTVLIQCGILDKVFVTDAYCRPYDLEVNTLLMPDIACSLLGMSDAFDDWSHVLPEKVKSKGFKPRSNVIRNIYAGITLYPNEMHLLESLNYARELKASYEAQSRNTKFILYLLHMEPESAVYPMSTTAISQASVVRALMDRYPEYLIEIREHPYMFSPDIGKIIPWMDEHFSTVRNELRWLVSESAQLRWSPLYKSTEERLSQAEALVCLNGSTSIYASLLGKPLILISTSFLSGHIGTAMIDIDEHMPIEHLKAEIPHELDKRVLTLSTFLSKRLRDSLPLIYDPSEGTATSQIKSSFLEEVSRLLHQLQHKKCNDLTN